MDFKDIYVATRFFEGDAALAPTRLAQLTRFIDAMLALGVGGIGIAINSDVDRSSAVEFISARYAQQVRAFPVTPWGKFVPSLAALLQQGCAEGCGKLLCASVEVELSEPAVAALANALNDDTLVAGLRLPGHSFEPGEHACDGHRSPWNTAALWRVHNGLDRLGFASTGEALFDSTGRNAGVEEVSTIALYQQLYTDCGAVLLDENGIDWKTSLSSKPEAVQEKLRSKISRPAAQLAHAHLEPGRVLHIVCPASN